MSSAILSDYSTATMYVGWHCSYPKFHAARLPCKFRTHLKDLFGGGGGYAKYYSNVMNKPYF